MRFKRRVVALLLTPLLLIALVLAYLSSWRVQVIKTSGADPFQVTFSPDGKYLAVAAHGAAAVHEFGSLDVWRVASPGFLRPAKVTNRHRFKMICPASLCFSGDSTRVVCTSYYSGSGITTWDAASGRKLGESDTDYYINNFVQPWPDKNTITYWHGDQIEQRDVSLKLKKPSPSSGTLLSSADDGGYDKLVAFAPNGKLVAWASSPYDSSVDNGVQLRPVGSKVTRLLPFDGCSGDDLECKPTALAFSPDSQSVIVARSRILYDKSQFTGGYGRLPAAHTSQLTLLWNVKTRSVVAQWSESSAVNAFAFSPDGQTIAEAHQDGSLHLRETASGTLLRTFKAHRHDAMSVAFSPDGTLLASCGGDGMLRLTRVR